MEDEKNKLWLKYLVLPAEVLFHKELTDADKKLFALIEMLDGPNGCFASNTFLSIYMQSTVQTISVGISKLKKNNFIKQVLFDGRKRILKVTDYKKIHRKSTEDKLIELDQEISGLKSTLGLDPGTPLDRPKVDFKHNTILEENNVTIIPKRNKNEAKPQRHVKIKRRKESRAEYRLFLLWNGFGKPLTVHKETSRIGINSLKALKKKLKRTSEAKIAQSIENYYNTLKIPEFENVIKSPGYVVSLYEFLEGFSVYTKKMIRQYSVAIEINCWFSECLPGKDFLSKFSSKLGLLEDDYPKITDKFKSEYVRRVFGGIKSKGSFSIYEENCFRKASIEMIDFFEINKKKLQIRSVDFKIPTRLVDYVFSAIEVQVNGNFQKVTPGWLCSDIMYSQTLPSYLKDQALVV